MDNELPHLNTQGEVHMVGVGEKAATLREAKASGRLYATSDVMDLVAQGRAKKGDVLAVARVAGIMAAKRTADIIPLCHPIPLTKVEIIIERLPTFFEVEVVCQTVSHTGVEMEALHAVSAALLTLYDMLKSQDKGMCIGGIKLREKRGGRSGEYVRESDD